MLALVYWFFLDQSITKGHDKHIDRNQNQEPRVNAAHHSSADLAVEAQKHRHTKDVHAVHENKQNLNINQNIRQFNNNKNCQTISLHQPGVYPSHQDDTQSSLQREWEHSSQEFSVEDRMAVARTSVKSYFCDRSVCLNQNIYFIKGN